MVRLIGLPALGVGLLLSLGCGELPPEQTVIRPVTELADLRLDIAMERTTVPVGDSSRVLISLRNLSAATLRLRFGSTCQITPYIETDAGVIQYPGGGSWVCGAAVTSLDVPARGEVTRTLVIRGVGSDAGLAGSSLPPGGYRVYALLDPISSGLSLRSPAIGFDVR